MDFYDLLERTMFESEIGLFEDYLKTVEEFLETEAQKHVASIEDLRASGQVTYLDDGPPPEEEYDRYRLDVIDQFSNMLRRAFFVSLYSFFETQVIEECHSRRSDDILPSFSDIAGQNDVERVKTYFAKVLRSDFPSNTREWQEIQNYRRLRNCIVHNRGKVDERIGTRNQRILQEYIARTKGLSLYGDTVYLDREFCEEACQIVEAFLWLLLFPGEELS